MSENFWFVDDRKLRRKHIIFPQDEEEEPQSSKEEKILIQVFEKN